MVLRPRPYDERRACRYLPVVVGSKVLLEGRVLAKDRRPRVPKVAVVGAGKSIMMKMDEAYWFARFAV